MMFIPIKARITEFFGKFFTDFNKVFVDFFAKVLRRGNQFTLSFNSLR